MDPLSITASIAALATIVAQVSHVLAEIRDDWDSLPGRIHALNNEIQDFTVVLHQVSIAVEERRLSGHDDDGKLRLYDLITRGEEVVLDLKAILERLSSAAGIRKRDAIPRVLMWRRDQGRVAWLQENIKQVKGSMNILLGAANSWVPPML